MALSIISLTLVLVAAAQVLAKINLPLEPASLTSLSTDVRSKRSSADLLDVPEWLQDIPQESRVAKYRKRRFLNFPTGSKLAFKITLSLPVDGLSDSTSIDFITYLSFNLPNNTNIITGRSFGNGHMRQDFYIQAENFLNSFGYDGHACTLRTICEVAEMPFDHGLFGEILNLLLSSTVNPSFVEANEIEDDYTIAESQGRKQGSCHELYADCPLSITNLLTHVVPKSM